MPASRPTLVTAALPYANGPLHLGHVAGAYLPPDLWVRYQRLKGEDVVFVCGSDEHGVAILIRAMQEGVEPQQIVDRYHAEIEAAFEGLGIAFDHYGRTSSAVHHATAQDFFRAIDAGGGFALKTSEQLFDPEAGLFLADRFVRGTCPVCGYAEAYGDQCESCGSSLSPDELIDPVSTLTEATPETRTTTHWTLPLDDWQPALEAWIAEHPDWKSNVRGQTRSWFDAGLTPRAMTRDLPWGVPVPEEAAARAGVDAAGKVMYVWFDAPIGYVSITKAWAEAQGDPERWRRYWQVDAGGPGASGTAPRLLHFIGKDNIVFHALIFPAILMALNEAQPDLPRFVLPDNVPANEFLNLEGRKLSTSRGWAVWLHEALEAFPPDVLRYGLAATLPETKDTDFNWGDFQARVNADLADTLGNFVHRTLTFAHRFTDGEVPALKDPSEADQAALKALAEAPAAVGAAYDAFRFRDAVAETISLARTGNKYFNDTEPWKARTENPQAMRNTLHVCLQLCAGLSVLMEPVLPHAAQTLRGMLKLDGVRPSTPGTLDTDASIGWAEAGTSLLDPGHTLDEAVVLFAKIEDEAVEAQRQLLADRSAAVEAASGTDEAPGAPYASVGETITYDDFAKLDLRLGEVLTAERVPKTDKLLRLEVDLGFEQRQVLAGIAQHMTPEEIVGRRVVLVANLAPRTIRGIESQGMVLMAEDREGALVPVGTGSEESEPGAIVK